MPITLPPINRREFIRGSLALGSTSTMLARGASAAARDGSKLDQNRVALLADTHISANPQLSYPGTKWPGSPVPEHEHESVNMARCLANVAKNIIALNPCLLYTSPSPRDATLSRMPSSA